MVFLENKIKDVDSWLKNAPPMGKETQWKAGRSAMELARYMTKDLPNVPEEMQKLLSVFVPLDSSFEWAAEYETDFYGEGLGKGKGRNHDAVLYNENIFVGIEGKADEALGEDLVGFAYDKGSTNKQKRIEGLSEMIFGNGPERHRQIRYQLLTASSAILLEAKKRNIKETVFLIIVFKKKGCYDPLKIENNDKDIERFMQETNAVCQGNYWEIPTSYGEKNGIKMHFAKIVIELGE